MDAANRWRNEGTNQRSIIDYCVETGRSFVWPA
jgi:hypothetical protein